MTINCLQLWLSSASIILLLVDWPPRCLCSFALGLAKIFHSTDLFATCKKTKTTNKHPEITDTLPDSDTDTDTNTDRDRDRDALGALPSRHWHVFGRGASRFVSGFLGFHGCGDGGVETVRGRCWRWCWWFLCGRADVFIQSALNWIIQSNQKEISPCKCQSNLHTPRSSESLGSV